MSLPFISGLNPTLQFWSTMNRGSSTCYVLCQCRCGRSPSVHQCGHIKWLRSLCSDTHLQRCIRCTLLAGPGNWAVPQSGFACHWILAVGAWPAQRASSHAHNSHDHGVLGKPNDCGEPKFDHVYVDFSAFAACCCLVAKRALDK
ncbi:hypothetical protein AMAG_17625 [Allomyces macrogynus ATCC 38327]|uniref:Uncharacterized protein n=1 Tax=Allomyces macrogynus (strain ATCC 38327) TaxID=578462 RepID=A0A0L0RVM4_ALLM3|nr:hypothetical protein AMAG_17625 [Allomyces macrogynus ATCC 38327]|eukprot:KNE54140.1 hypothetical protein AMAG_17625 [Allomyces macrogynus ATCC 38327]